MTNKHNSTTSSADHTDQVNSQFQFVFDKVMHNQRTMKMFKDFLVKSLHSPEAILFYEKVIEYKSFEGQSLGDHQIKLAQYILDHFISPGSAHEINIGKKERNQVIERVRRITSNSPHTSDIELENQHNSNSKQTLNKKENETDEQSECSTSTATNKPKSISSMSETSTFMMVEPINIFDEALVTVQRQLKEDVFPLFLRSDKFVAFCKKASREVLGEIGYVRRHSRQTGKVSIEDYWKFYSADCGMLNVTGQDVKCLSSLSIDSSDWTLLEQEYFKKSCYATFVSSESHCMIRPETTEYRNPNSQNVYKCTGVINHSAHKVLQALTDSHFMATYDNNLAQCECIDYVNSQLHETTLPQSLFELEDTTQFTSSIILQNYPFNWPLSGRDFLTSQTVVYEPSTQRYFIIIKSVNHQLAKPKEGTIRSYLVGGWIIQPISDEYSRYTLVNYMDVNMSEKLVQQFQLRRGKKLFHSLNKILKEMVDSPVVMNDDSCGLLETLEEYLDLYEINIEQGKKSKKLNKMEMKELLTPRKTHHSTENLQLSNKIIRLTYISKCKKNFDSSELDKIATTASQFNSSINVTGLLLYCKEGLFYQVLEGEKERVSNLYEKIRQDSRHFDVKCVKMEKDLDERDRQFKGWAMNTVNLETSDHFFADFMKDLLVTVSKLELNNMTEDQAIEFIFKSSRQMFTKSRNENFLSKLGSCFCMK